ncbi:MAG: hypothetical protein M9904_11075 [Chitinophagaceae bacterium]|nr:hypothetical protein [Chitinophagaceae bacterium]
MKKFFVFYIAAFVIMQSCNEKGRDTEGYDPVLLSNIYNKASCVFLTNDEKNNPVISWTEIDSTGEKHFYFANWNVKSQQFAPGLAIPIASNTSIHEEGMPKVAVKGDGTLVATYETSVPSEKSRFGLSDIQYVMSFDKGKTWTHHQSIQPDAVHTGSRSFGNMIRLDDGEIGLSWLDTDPDTTNRGRPVKFARTKGSEGFDNAILIKSSACQCCRTALSSNGWGNVRVVFRDLLSGSVRDISVCSSADNGLTFDKAVPFSNDHWVVDGCPHNGPSVVSKNEHTYAAWFTGSEQNGVFYGELDEQNNMLSKQQLDRNGRFVQLCLMPDSSRIVAYNSTYRMEDSVYHKIVVNKIEGKNIFQKEVTLPHAHAAYPVVQPAGKQQVIVAWTDNGRIYYTKINTNTITEVANAEEAQPLAVKKRLVFSGLSVYHDPVCGMKIDKRSIVDTTLFHQKTIGFCSHGCKAMFLKDPNAYRVKE